MTGFFLLQATLSPLSRAKKCLFLHRLEFVLLTQTSIICTSNTPWCNWSCNLVRLLLHHSNVKHSADFMTFFGTFAILLSSWVINWKPGRLDYVKETALMAPKNKKRALTKAIEFITEEVVRFFYQKTWEHLKTLEVNDEP